jgi:hypothetical protein
MTLFWEVLPQRVEEEAVKEYQAVAKATTRLEHLVADLVVERVMTSVRLQRKR